MILKVDGTLPPEKKRRDLMVEPNIQIFQASLTWKQEIIESLIHIFWLNKCYEIERRLNQYKYYIL